MMRATKARNDGRGFLARLRRDTAGNTMAMMAAALVPLIGFTGSAVDMARLYVVKVRLQQACDAGALAARHAMSDTDPSKALDKIANDQGQQFFKSNFETGWFQAANPVFTPAKGKQGPSAVANAVTATATVTVPMALMSYFGAPPVNLSVSCQAVFDVTDNDIMFVLDNTGSTSCYPSDPPDCGGTQATYTRTDGTPGYYDIEKSPTQVNGSTMYSKIESLRQAVVLFDSTLRANADTTTHFRYGFVPYTSAVNVGAAIPAQYLQSGTWKYQSRQVSGDYNYTNKYNLANGTQVQGATSVSLTNVPQASCVPQRYPATGYTQTGPTWGNAGFYMAVNYYNLSWTSANGGTCSGQQQPLRATWSYQQWPLNISQYVATLGTQNTVPDPTRLDGSTSKWRGCIEEVDTTTGSSFSVSSLPDDLNPDFAPSSATDKWRPMWPDAIWLRDNYGQQSMNDESINESSPQSYTSVSFKYGSFYGNYTSCGMAAQRLQEMSSKQVHDYVYANDFKPYGGTYHDVGMIWGTRMLSPNGVFAADTAAWPGRNPPARSIVFMTDGIMDTAPRSYEQYGVETWDQRTGAADNRTTDIANHTARFRVECDAAKARGITVYVVALGTGLTDDLNYCASPGQAFTASSTDQLTAAFANIAKRVAKLRISQ